MNKFYSYLKVQLYSQLHNQINGQLIDQLNDQLYWKFWDQFRVKLDELQYWQLCNQLVKSFYKQ